MDIAKTRIDLSAELADASLWSIEIPFDENMLSSMQSVLDDSEQARAGRYVQSEDRARFVATRHALRELLSSCTGEHPAALQFHHTANGRPVLSAYPELEFSVSHSGRHALIAIAKGRAIGVDIEQIDRRTNWQDLAPAALSAAEVDAISTLPEDAQRAAFFRCWTAKEALLKAVGLGIAGVDDLRTVSVEPLNDSPQRAQLRLNDSSTRALGFCWVNHIADYVSCIAWGCDR